MTFCFMFNTQFEKERVPFKPFFSSLKAISYFNEQKYPQEINT